MFVNRNILQSVADANDEATVSTILSPLDAEIQFIQGKTLTLKVGSDHVDFLIELEASMFDEKMDKSRLGEDGNGSSCICILCTANGATAKTQLGSFSITRTIEQIIDLATKRIENPDNLSDAKLRKACEGVKCLPFMRDLGVVFEGLLADLSWVRFILTIAIHVKEKILQWRETNKIREQLKMVKREMDDYIRLKTGLQPALQLPGNYAREIMAEENENLLSGFIGDDFPSERESLKEVCSQYR